MALDWKEFGRQSYRYLLSPAWHCQKKYNQTHNTTPTNGVQAVFAPINKLNLAKGVATPGSELFVTPNVNVVYGSAHVDLDVSAVLMDTATNINQQYCIWQFMDAFMNVFAYIGSTNTNNDPNFYEAGGQYYLMYGGPNGDGEGVERPDGIPEGFEPIYSKTRDVWLVMRYFTNPENPGETAQRMFQECLLGPVSDFGPNIYYDNRNYPYVPAMDITSAPEKTGQAAQQIAQALYEQMNPWLTRNGWGPSTESFQTEMLQFGLGPDQNTNWEEVFADSTRAQAIVDGIKVGFGEIEGAQGDPNYIQFIHNWGYSINDEMGDYGTDYLLRSLIAYIGLGANKLEQCVYPGSDFPAGSPTQSYNSSYQYEFTIPAAWLNPETLPYVTPGFWSFTAYMKDGGTLPKTADGTFPTIYQPGRVLKTITGGDAKVIIQSNPLPDSSPYNWMPGPVDSNQEFYLIMRVYGPNGKMYGYGDGQPVAPWTAPIVSLYPGDEDE